ncbi:MAG: O-antigen ligase family protein [Patescibacteria group bacterium]
MNIERILRSLVIGGVFLTPFLALVVLNDMFFPFITGKNFAFRALVEIIFGAWLVLALTSPSYRPKRSWILIALGAFVVVMTVADLFGVNISRSFWSNYERMEGLVTLLHLFAYFVVATSVLTTEKLWERLLQVSLGASVIVGIYGLFQLSGAITINQGGVRLDATFGNATYLAVYMLFHIFIAALLSVRTRFSLLRLVYGATMLLNVFILYHTATRGTILGLIGGVLLTALLIALFERERPLFRKIAGGVIIGVIVLAGVFFAIKDTNFVKKSPVLSRFSGISLQEQTTKSRFQIWGMAIEGFKENPLLGWGQDNFNLVFNKYYDSRLYDQEPFFDRAHNVFLDWLIAGGIVGLLAYLSIFAAALFYIWRRRDNSFSVMEKSVITGLFAAYFFQNLFVFDNLISYVLFVTMLGYIHTMATMTTAKNSEQKEPVRSAIPEHTVMAIVLVATIILIYAVNAKGFLANRALIQGMTPQEAGLEKNIEYFKKALAYNSFGTPEVREHLMQTTGRIVSTGAPQDMKQKFILLARDEMGKQIKETPDDMRYELLIGSFLNSVGAPDEAIAHLERAIELSPSKQSTYFELANSYLGKGQYDKALLTMKTAYEIEPKNGTARDIYAVIAIYNKNFDLAKELLVPVYGTIAVPDDRFIQAFAAVKDYETVINIWKERILKAQTAGADNAQFHVSLAAAYLANEERTKAIAELEKATELNPEFKAQADYYIGEIRAGRNP